MSLYLVGDERAAKANDWWAICRTRDEAERVKALLDGATIIKEVKV